MKPLEALERIKKANYFVDFELNARVGEDYKDELDIIEKELVLLNALRIKLDRKIKTKEYIYEASNGYRIGTLLTYELKEQWDDKELQALKQFLLNLSGISKELKALEIIKEKVMPLVSLEDKTSWKENCYRVYDANEMYMYTE